MSIFFNLTFFCLFFNHTFFLMSIYFMMCFFDPVLDWRKKKEKGEGEGSLGGIMSWCLLLGQIPPGSYK